MQLDGDGELHGVIAAQAVAFGKPLGGAEQGGRDFKDIVLMRGVVTELGDQGGSGGNRDDAAAPSAANGGDHFHAADAGQEKLMRSRRVGQAMYPAAAELFQVTLDYGAGVEDECRHVSGARG